MKGNYYMKNKIIKLLIACFIISSLAIAKSPVRYMTLQSIGIEYTCLWRGQTITEAVVPSHEQFWYVNVNYAPFEYLQFLFGLGSDRFKVDTYDDKTFKGNYGFSFSAGAYAYSPAFVNKLFRVTAGSDFLYLNCKDDHNYKYSGPVADPIAGIIIHAGGYVDVEIGAKGHFIIGKMQNINNDETEDFSNNEYIKGYLNLTACSPFGAYAQFHFDASPKLQEDWKKGPYEASMGFTVGIILKDERAKKKGKKGKKGKKEKSKYFPEYEDMKKKQDKMKEDIE